MACTNRAVAAYAQKYNEEYARTPKKLAIVDSLFRGAADGAVAMAEAGKRVKFLQLEP